MYEVKPKKQGHTIFYTVMALLIIGFFLLYNIYIKSLKAIDSSDKEFINVDIPEGTSTLEIGDILKRNNLIKNKWIFLFKFKTIGNKGFLKAGNYDLNRSMDLEKLIDTLINGDKIGDTITFTIPEGYEIKDIARKLAEEGIINSNKFLVLVSDKGNFEGKFKFLRDLDNGQSLEGFLFPATYEIYKSHSEEDIIIKMLEGFEDIYEKDIKPNFKDINLNLNEIITLASIVEKEARLDSERSLISAVFHNRLKINMNLQSCATVQYILGERKEVLSIAETKIKSPFNTYINLGLPPSPIASPGEKSIIATLKPENVDYLFFRLTGKDGSHTFTKTYEEHLNAASKK